MSKSFNLEAFKNGKKALTRDGRVATFVRVCEKCPNNEKLIAHINWDDNITSYSLRGTYRSSKESDYDLVSMVSRHQALIDSYDPEDTWQFNVKTYDEWFDIKGKPEWEECREFRLHPHNDLIKAYKKGAKIECKHKDKEWRDASSDDIRSWYEDAEYRIKQEPEHTYPIYKQFKTTGPVVKFTGMTTGKVISSGITAYNVGEISDIWFPHTYPSWQDWTPPTKTVYEWIHEANAGNVNYFVSSWVADEDVEYFFGLDAPKQKYKTGRSMEVEV